MFLRVLSPGFLFRKIGSKAEKGSV